MPAVPPRAVRVHVSAKVNLHLSVGALRPDGFHDLVTVFHAIDLTDVVVASPAAALSLTLAGEGADVLPAGEENLVWQAARLLADAAGVPAHAKLGLTKFIPVAGGLAGGSADAAATLLACAEMWDVEADLPALAAQLGSDVAFPLMGGTALGTGRGEILEPVPVAGELHWVLAVCDFGISAGAAYRELDRQRAAGGAPEPAGSPHALLDALAAGHVEGVADHLVNDLQPAALALAPSLFDVLAAGRKAGALAGIVSGSGPTCVFLCADAAAASAVVRHLNDAGVCREAWATTGPAAAPRVSTIEWSG